jgi:hypothetical protein
MRPTRIFSIGTRTGLLEQPVQPTSSQSGLLCHLRSCESEARADLFSGFSPAFVDTASRSTFQKTRIWSSSSSASTTRTCLTRRTITKCSSEHFSSCRIPLPSSRSSTSRPPKLYNFAFQHTRLTYLLSTPLVIRFLLPDPLFSERSVSCSSRS